MIAELPGGTLVRIERLMRDNGVAGVLWVTGSLEDGKVVYLSYAFLAANRFLRTGNAELATWGVNPEMLEKTSEQDKK